MALLGEETSPGDIAGILTRVKGMLHGDRFSMEINSALKPEPLRPALSSLLNLGCCGDGFLTQREYSCAFFHFFSFGHANHASQLDIHSRKGPAFCLFFRTKNGVCLFNIVII